MLRKERHRAEHADEQKAISGKLETDRQGKEGKRRMGLRVLRKTMQAAGGTFRHSPADIDGRTHEPHAGRLPARKHESIVRALPLEIRRETPCRDKKKETVRK